MVSWMVKASYGLTSVSGQATVITGRVSSAGAVRDGCETLDVERIHDASERRKNPRVYTYPHAGVGDFRKL